MSLFHCAIRNVGWSNEWVCCYLSGSEGSSSCVPEHVWINNVLSNWEGRFLPLSSRMWRMVLHAWSRTCNSTPVLCLAPFSPSPPVLRFQQEVTRIGTCNHPYRHGLLTSHWRRALNAARQSEQLACLDLQGWVYHETVNLNSRRRYGRFWCWSQLGFRNKNLVLGRPALMTVPTVCFQSHHFYTLPRTGIHTWPAWACIFQYSRTPLIRTLLTRIANYPLGLAFRVNLSRIRCYWTW